MTCRNLWRAANSVATAVCTEGLLPPEERKARCEARFLVSKASTLRCGCATSRLCDRRGKNSGM